MEKPIRRTPIAAPAGSLVLLSDCSGQGTADRTAGAEASPVSPVARLLESRSGHPYAARFRSVQTGVVDRETVTGVVNLGARVTGTFTVSTPVLPYDIQNVLLADRTYARRVDGNGRTVKGWWRAPLENAGPPNQILAVDAVARLLARQPSQAHRGPSTDPSGRRGYRLSGFVEAADFQDIEPSVHVMPAPWEDIPGTKGIACTVRVDEQGRVTRFDEELTYSGGSEYHSTMTLTRFGPPVPIAPPVPG